MNHNIFLPAGFLLSLLIILYLLQKLLRVQKQLSLIQEALSDFKNGNRNRRVLTRENDMTKQICHTSTRLPSTVKSSLPGKSSPSLHINVS